MVTTTCKLCLCKLDAYLQSSFKVAHSSGAAKVHGMGADVPDEILDHGYDSQSILTTIAQNKSATFAQKTVVLQAALP